MKEQIKLGLTAGVMFAGSTAVFWILFRMLMPQLVSLHYLALHNWEIASSLLMVAIGVIAVYVWMDLG